MRESPSQAGASAVTTSWRRRDLAVLALWPAVSALPLMTLTGPVVAEPAAVGATVTWPNVRLLDGRVWSAESMREQATVVVFFSTDCPFCRRHNRHVDKLMRGLEGRVDGRLLRVVGACQDRDAAAVQAYVNAQGYGFPVTLDAEPLHAALSSRRVIPLTCVVDRRGVLREVIPGEMFEEDVLGLLKWA